MVGCSAFVALIVIITILVSILVPAYDFNRKAIYMLRLHFESVGVQSTVVIFTYNS